MRISCCSAVDLSKFSLIAIMPHHRSLGKDFAECCLQFEAVISCQQRYVLRCLSSFVRVVDFIKRLVKRAFDLTSPEE